MRLLSANDVAERWRGRERFVVVAIGVGAVPLFLAAWHSWRGDSHRCRVLHFIAIDRDLPGRDDLASWADETRAAEGGEADRRDDGLVERLISAWPPLTPNLHRVVFDRGGVQLLLAAGAPSAWMREIVASVDAFVVTDDCNGRGLLVEQPRVAKTLARLAVRGATLVAQSTSGATTSALRAVGFVVDGASRQAAERGIAAHHEPAYPTRLTTTRSTIGPQGGRPVVIVGAGLAGCAVACALAEQGWSSVVIERRCRIAAEASGNAAGLFHGIVNGQDGTHARFNRAAALAASTAVATAIAEHAVTGQRGGLLQLIEPTTSSAAMRALLTRLRLPEGYVQALDPVDASGRAGLSLEQAAWFYPGGGWVDPAGLARSFIERAGAKVDIRFDIEVATLQRDGGRWRLLDRNGHVIEIASTLVLANAGDALRLCGGTWPIEAVRGQTSVLRGASKAGLRLPQLPITGAGYLLPEVDGDLVFGATADRDDADPQVRVADHLRNLAQLARLAPDLAAGIAPTRLDGRTAWRSTSRDRLPLIGSVPQVLRSASSSVGEAIAQRDQLRFVGREPGLYLFTALGSRGITWAALGGAVLAAMISGAPLPLEASLLDAVDPARFGVRDARRRSSSKG